MLISKIGHQNIKNLFKVKVDPCQEELNQFERNNVWTLVLKPHNKLVIGTRWVFKNNLNEDGNVTRNKARLVSERYNQHKCIDYIQAFAPITRFL